MCPSKVRTGVQLQIRISVHFNKNTQLDKVITIYFALSSTFFKLSSLDFNLHLKKKFFSLNYHKFCHKNFEYI